jgi:hypothetical protein
MVPLVEIPEIVRHYAPFFASVFSPPALVQFQRYISGLIVSENKTVEGINRLFVLEVRNQSSLNRLLTESPFSPEAVNEARLALLGSLAGGRTKIFSRSELKLILFLFRVALRGKEGAARSLHGFSELFPTPRKDRFRWHAFQCLFDDFGSGVGDDGA